MGNSRWRPGGSDARSSLGDHWLGFSSGSGYLSSGARIDHILGQKSSLRKFKKIGIVSSIFSDHNVMRLEINYRKKTCKKHKHMEAKQYATK